ncbi:MAG: universal stress protein [Thermodesulfobacteriota bacterium]|nr:universal stress protein [Thermodesulfobacteriota bacterium]
MKRFKNILLVYDGRESGQSTLARAIDLATRNQARLTVIQVISQIPRDYRLLNTSLFFDEIMENAVREHTLLLEKHIALFPETGRIQLKVVAGREFIEIIKEVLRNNHDLVIKTVHGMGGTTSDMLFGSTAMHLLRKCPCPVWLKKPGQGERFHRIMAAVDVVPLEIEENNLNNIIMELATSQARLEKSNLHIVHVWKKPDARLLAGGLDYFSGDIERLSNETKNMHIRLMDDLLGQYDLQHLQYNEYVIQGWADEVVPEFAEQHQIDLIVMGTVCRTGIPGFCIGDTAEKILHRIDCSVLAVKPDGFISPVQLDE